MSLVDDTAIFYSFIYVCIYLFIFKFAVKVTFSPSQLRLTSLVLPNS